MNSSDILGGVVYLEYLWDALAIVIPAYIGYRLLKEKYFLFTLMVPVLVCTYRPRRFSVIFSILDYDKVNELGMVGPPIDSRKEFLYAYDALGVGDDQTRLFVRSYAYKYLGFAKINFILLVAASLLLSLFFVNANALAFISLWLGALLPVVWDLAKQLISNNWITPFVGGLMLICEMHYKSIKEPEN